MDELQRLFRQKQGLLNGFSWVMKDEIGGMRQPTTAELANQVVETFNIGLIVSLTEHPLEFSSSITNTCKNIHLPVTDFDIPRRDQIVTFIDASRQTIIAGKSIAVHCHAGYGRTGTFIACYLVSEKGFSSEEAISLVRKQRPGSIANRKQEDFIHNLKIELKSTKELN